MEKDKSFVFHCEWMEYLNSLSPEKAYEVISGIVSFCLSGNPPTFNDPMQELVCKVIFNRLKSDKDKYQKTCERRRENGSKGGRPKNQTVKEKSKKTKWFLEKAKKPDIDIESDTDIESDIDIDIDTDIESDTDNIPPKSPQGDKRPDDVFEGRSIPEPIKAEVRKWLEYKKERRETYKPTGLLSFLSTVEKKCAMYGEEDIVDLIEESMSNGWRGIIWDHLSGKEKPAEKPEELPPDLLEAKQQHEEAMKRFRAGEANWEDLIP